MTELKNKQIVEQNVTTFSSFKNLPIELECASLLMEVLSLFKPLQDLHF